MKALDPTFWGFDNLASVPELIMQTDIEFTTQAANKVKQLIEIEGNSDLKLRVFVTGGGCSGLSYGFTFDDEILLGLSD